MVPALPAILPIPAIASAPSIRPAAGGGNELRLLLVACRDSMFPEVQYRAGIWDCAR